MPNIFVRILVAVIACVLAFLLIPLVASAIGLPLSSTLLAIIKICIAGIAVFYILRGTSWPLK